MNPPLTILVAEDDTNDALLLKLAFAEAGVNAHLHFVRDGSEAMDYLRGTSLFSNRAKHPLPDLLMLDLKMQRADGFVVLAWLRQQPGNDRMTVAVLTGSSWQADLDRAHALGAKFCLKKPVDFRQLVDVVKRIAEERSKPLVPVPPHRLSKPPRPNA